VTTTAAARSTAESRRQRAIRRRRTEPIFDHIRASSASELPAGRQSGDDREPLTPNFVDDEADEKHSQKNEPSLDEVAEQVDRAKTSPQIGGDQRTSQTKRKPANGDARRNTDRRVPDTESAVPEPALDVVPKSFPVPVAQRQAARSPGVSPKSVASSDRLSQDTVTLGYLNEEQHLADLNVANGGSPNSPQEPASTDHAAHRPVDCRPDPPLCGPSQLDGGYGDRPESENFEERKKTTSGVRLEGVQSAAAMNPDSCGPSLLDGGHNDRPESQNNEDRRKSTSGDRSEGAQSAAADSSDSFLADQTSANAAVDFGISRENLEQLINSAAEMVGPEVGSVASGNVDAASGQAGTPPDHCNVAQTSNMADGSSLTLERKRRTSVAVTRRRRPGKSPDIHRGQPTDLVAKKPRENLTAIGSVSPALQNGIKSPSDDECRTLENKRFT